MKQSLADGWRVLDRLDVLSWAEAIRRVTQAENPTLEVRVRIEDGKYLVESRNFFWAKP